MKSAKLFNVLLLGLLISATVVGCKRSPKGTTAIPKMGGVVGDGMGDGRILSGLSSPDGVDGVNRTDGTGTGQTRPIDWDKSQKDNDALAPHTIYFDLDRFAIRPSERSKLEAVAGYMRANTSSGILVEGHCDERGTEGYNDSLGERRAGSVREALIAMGLPADRIHTVSLGEARPAVQGTGEAAYSKNRRAQFVVVLPAQ